MSFTSMLPGFGAQGTWHQTFGVAEEVSTWSDEITLKRAGPVKRHGSETLVFEESSICRCRVQLTMASWVPNQR